MSIYFTPEIRNQTLEHVWKTSIQENIQGGEKRSALFTWPRIRLENTLQFITEKTQRFIRAHYERDIHNLWYFPIVSDKTILTADANAGQKVIAVEETSYRHFYDGRECILIADWETYEVVTIGTVDSSTQITASVNLTATWPAGSLIYPLYATRIKPMQSRMAKHLNLSHSSIVAEESFESIRSFSYTLPIIDTTVFPVYNSLNLFLMRPLSPIEEKFQHPYMLLSFLGKQITYSNYGDTRAILNRELFMKTKKEIYDTLDFFDAQRGRFGTFYTPTWLKDIIITVGFDATDTTLTVQKLYMTESEIVGRHVYIQFPDRECICREVTARPSETSITIDSAIGKTVSTIDLDDVLCCFLPKVRFNQDNVKLDYLQKSNQAKISLNFKTL